MWKSNNPSLQVLTQSTVSVIGVSQQQKPKTSETSTNVTATLFHNTTRKVHAGKVNLVTCCYFGSSALLVSWDEANASCIKFTKSIQQITWNCENKLDLKNMSCLLPNLPKTLPDMQGHAKVCKNNSTSRNIQTMPEIYHPCISTSHISCKPCSHHRHDIGKLQFTDIPAKFHIYCIPHASLAGCDVVL